MSKQNQKSKPADLERFGRLIADVYETGYVSRGRIYRMSFLKGLMAGFGGVVGATIVVGLLVWVLSLLDAIPYIDDLRNAIEQGR